MSVEYIQTGNTVKFTVTFGEDWSPELVTPVDPELIKFIVYNPGYKKLEEHTLTSANKVSTGVYQYFWQPINTQGARIIEWYGEIESLPTLKRFVLDIQFV